MRVEHINRRIDLQRSLSDEISDAYSKMMNDGNGTVSTHRIQTRLEAVKELWQRFASHHQAINIALPLVSSRERSRLTQRSYFVKSVYSTTYSNYLETVEKMTELLDIHSSKTVSPKAVAIPESFTSSASTVQPSSSTPNTTLHMTRLPRLDVPKFNGARADWLSFKGLFTSLVYNNPSLSAVEKLQYLKMSLIGRAEHLLKNT